MPLVELLLDRNKPSIDTLWVERAAQNMQHSEPEPWWA